jgi:hypothetical protein
VPGAAALGEASEVDHGGGDGVVAEDVASAAEGLVAGDDPLTLDQAPVSGQQRAWHDQAMSAQSSSEDAAPALPGYGAGRYPINKIGKPV